VNMYGCICNVASTNHSTPSVTWTPRRVIPGQICRCFLAVRTPPLVVAFSLAISSVMTLRQ